MEVRHKLYHPLQIGSLSLNGNLFLAPMAGVTDKATRQICLEEGADFTFSEMVSSAGLVYESHKTHEILEKADKEEKIAIQLFGSDPYLIAASVKKVLEFGADLIDLNCGCPVSKVTKTGAGSALMRDPKKIGDIVSALKNETDLPVSVKLRSGWTAEEETFLEAADAAAEAGASLITLHPRSRAQGYSGKADWSLIRRLKKHVSVAVCGSGDLFSALDARKMLEETGCDAVMFARGIIGRPFLFRQTKQLLEQGITAEEPGAEQKIALAWKHIQLDQKYKKGRRAFLEVRKHLCGYTKGLPGSASLRTELMHCQSAEEYQKVLNDYLSREIPDHRNGEISNKNTEKDN